MALIQLDKGVVEQPDMELEPAVELYDEKVATTKALMNDKNHDYGEAWRDMRVSSFDRLDPAKVASGETDRRQCWQDLGE